MPLTSSAITSQILNQLWVLDPAMSAEIGTPERKIIEAVAETIASAQVDYSVLGQRHDLDSMSGSTLDSYLGQLGFGRQVSRPSVGLVTFSRTTPATEPIVIPNGTQLRATLDSSSLPDLIFVTTATVVLAVGSTSVDAPIRCTISGAVGNLPANSIQAFSGFSAILGITSLTNTQPTSSGVDGEDDAAFKLRFKNSIFRNMSGTYDHILALALSAVTVGKANVVGPISRYHEHVQVPAVSSTGENEVQLISVPDDVTAWKIEVRTPDAEADAVIATTVDLGNDTTAAAVKTALNTAVGGATGFIDGRTYFDVTMTGTDPRIYTITFLDRFGRRGMRALTTTDVTGTAPTITADGSGASTLGVAPTGIDAVQPTIAGSYDANLGTVADILAWPFKLTTEVSTIPYAKYTYLDNAFLTDGTLDPGTAEFHRPYVDFVFNSSAAGHVAPAVWDNAFVYDEGDVVYDIAETGVFVALNGGTSAGSEPTWVDAAIGDLTVDNDIEWAYCGEYDPDTPTRYDLSPLYGAAPNVTILGAQATDGSPSWPASLQPDDLALLEFQYISRNSRNDFTLGILNAVDVYVDGAEERVVSSVEVMPTSANDLQATDPEKWTYQKTSAPTAINFRRTLDGEPADPGNRIIPLHWQPITSVPDSISIGEDVYLRANYYNTGDSTYYNAVQDDGTYLAVDKAHYAAVEEVNNYYGTIRSRSGIEFFKGLTGLDNNYVVGLRYVDGELTATGEKFTEYEGIQFTVSNYTYDENIPVSQALQEANAPVTNDMLVHRALRRYFRTYVTIMYNKGATQSIVDAAIQTALAVFFQNQFYGAAIQLSDILAAIHAVPGVDNVRWTRDTDGVSARVEEVNATGSTVIEEFNADFFIEDRELAVAAPIPAIIVRRAANVWGT
jgi:uncharacterized phage protein gp47/JayE